MKSIPVGSIVVLQNCINYPELNGEEVTITCGLASRWLAVQQEELLTYETDKTHKGTLICPLPRQVRLKKLPPDSMFDSFLNKIVQPLGQEEMQRLLEEKV